MKKNQILAIVGVVVVLLVGGAIVGLISLQEKHSQIKTAIISVKADASISPKTQSIQAGDDFDIKIYINTNGESMEAYSLSVNYDKTKVIIDGTKGKKGVDKGADTGEYMLVVNPSFDNGHYIFSGIKSSKDAVSNTLRHVGTVHMKALSSFISGSTAISLSIRDVVINNNDMLAKGTVTGAVVEVKGNTPSAVDGDCGGNVNDCSVGVVSNKTNTSTEYRWDCVGSNGGSTAHCTETISGGGAVNGGCGNAVNRCITGALNDISDSSTQYRWDCVGSNGGTTAHCQKERVSNVERIVLREVKAVASPTNSIWNDYKINLDRDAKSLKIKGGCGMRYGTNELKKGTLTIYIEAYHGVNNCSLVAIDAAGHESNELTISAFEVVFNTTGQVVCGNGTIENTEECDDGNTLTGDGCDTNCRLENAVIADSTTTTSTLNRVAAVVDDSANSNNDNDDSDERCDASIGNYIWYDTNGNGVQDSIEEGIPGIKVCVYNGNKKYCDKTNKRGRYKIKDLCKGTYDLVVKNVGGKVQTYDPDGKRDSKTKVKLKFSKDKHTKADFGYRGSIAPKTGLVTNVVLSLAIVLLLTLGVLFLMKKKDQI